MRVECINTLYSLFPLLPLLPLLLAQFSHLFAIMVAPITNKSSSVAPPAFKLRRSSISTDCFAGAATGGAATGGAATGGAATGGGGGGGGGVISSFAGGTDIAFAY